MGIRFVNKTFRDRPTHGFAQQPTQQQKPVEEVQTTQQDEQKKNKKTKKNSDMLTNEEKIQTAEELLGEIKPEVKVVKKERGLIERTESSKIILTEDNRQVLND